MLKTRREKPEEIVRIVLNKGLLYRKSPEHYTKLRRFAADMLIFINSPEELQCMLKELAVSLIGGRAQKEFVKKLK